MPRRSEVLAALAAAAVAAAVLLAPLSLILAAAFHAVSKVSRWRPLWLWAVAACGVVWVLAVGPGETIAGFGHSAVATAGALSRIFTGPAAVARAASAVYADGVGQLPLALVLSAVAAALAWWVRWMHTDEWDVPAARPGLVHIGRRQRTAAALRRGRVLTRDGACLGVDAETGAPAALSWRDASGGVLLTGASERAVLASGLRLAHAAIRRRKPVIVVDLAGGAGLPDDLAGICASVRAPLHVFGAADGFRYEPRVRPSVEQHAALGAVPWGPRPALGAGTGVSLDEVVRRRAVALFALAGTGPREVAEVIAGLVAADVAALYSSLCRDGIAPDGLCWFTECDGVDPVALAGLAAAGSPAGLAPVLATTVPRAAGGLAGRVNAVVIHQLADYGLAGELATLTGTAIVPMTRARAGAEYGTHLSSQAEASPAVPFGTMLVPLVPAERLCALGRGDFVLITGLTAGPADGRRRGGAGVAVRARCRAVSEPVPAPPGGTGLPVRRPA